MADGFFARVVRSERFEAWQSVFGRYELPIVSPIPEIVCVPDYGFTRAYALDLDEVTAEDRERLIEHIAKRFELSVDYVAERIEQLGVPILADGVIVVMDDSCNFGDKGTHGRDAAEGDGVTK